jgi:hypothetical protein
MNRKQRRATRTVIVLQDTDDPDAPVLRIELKDIPKVVAFLKAVELMDVPLGQGVVAPFRMPGYDKEIVFTPAGATQILALIEAAQIKPGQHIIAEPLRKQ